MAKRETKEAPRIRELFVEELAEIRGGATVDGGTETTSCCVTTMACCEEGPDGCCPILIA